jgi:hypothetical protein
MQRRHLVLLSIICVFHFVSLIAPAQERGREFVVINPDPVQAPPNGSPYLYARWTPAVIYADGVTSARLEVWTTGGVKSIHIGSAGQNFGELNDSGVDGDRKAGDDIWTYGAYTRIYSNFMFQDHSLRGTDVTLERNDGGTEEHSMPSLGLVRELNEKVTKIKKNVYATKWAVFLIDKRGKLLGGNLPVCDVRCGKGNEAVFQEFFKSYPDKFDFLTVFPACTIFRPADLAENVPYCVPVQNKVRNIGVEIFNDTKDFGSSGKLQAIIYHSFGYGAILDHEIAHNWGVRIGEAQGFSGATCKYGQAYGWHYGPYSDVCDQMAAFPQLKVEDNGDGTYKVTKHDTGASKPISDQHYAPLTLYQMGLVPPSDVPPIMFLTDPDYPNYNKIPASKFDKYTIQSILAANGGERQPAYPKTQKRFRMGFIIVTDRKPTQAEYDFFSAIARYFASKEEGDNYLVPFYTAAEGKGKLVTKLPKAKAGKQRRKP